MLTEIVSVHERLVSRLHAFNQVWPHLVVSGTVWKLPVLAEQKAPDRIDVQRLEGQPAIEAALQAMMAFERVVGQAPGTVMRLPGYFALRDSVLPWVREINDLKDELMAMIEKTRLELNLATTARSKILRQALGHQFSMKQLGRHTQAFDSCPRLIVFTWAGHTTGGERVEVGKVRELLAKTAEQQSDRDNVTPGETLAGAELRRIVNLADHATLIKYKKVAPHPRAMLYFSASSRYDAMIHSNLPLFVLAGEKPIDVHELRDFDRHTRQAERPDKKARIEVIPRMNLYLNPNDLVGMSPSQLPQSRSTLVASTYSDGRSKTVQPSATTADDPLDLNLAAEDD
ncbi:replication terminus site-binding protein [Pseudomonas syringae]|nr:replication terminus site-binding protein [Pseudomonas syringae]MBD8793105.1 replication terminus site-binding protein [Pseudomonas syringae]MBD8802922.1 replication terminus site-binding protein [Pseudomonas syringae]MBD8813634.1 replication terminus site-binding protein [Pseudomonas syringae]